jgi:hypothetical protein
VVFLGDSLQYFSGAAQSKHLMRKADDAAGIDAGLRSSMFCYRLAGGIEDGFGKGKFEHDLTFIIGHFENRIQKTTLRVFGLQQFPNHGSRNFPCAIRISQLFAFWIGDQFVADTRVEEISRHGWKAIFVEGPRGKPVALTSYLFGTRHANIDTAGASDWMSDPEPVDLSLF